MSNKDLSIVNRKKRISYSEFLKERIDIHERNRYITLFEIQNFYNQMNLTLYNNDQYNYSSYKNKKVNTYGLHLFKLSIIDNRLPKMVYFNSNKCFHRQNLIFLMALMNNDVKVVKFFLDKNFPQNINSRIFGNENFYTPTYLMLAVSLNNPVILSLFLGKSINIRASWLGINPIIISTCNTMYRKLCYTDSPLTYISSSQYLVLNQKKIRFNDIPIFPIDFLCMRNDIKNIEFLLNQNPKAAQLSQICYLVQNDIKIVYLLLSFSVKHRQELNGLTPIHVAAFCNNLAGIVVFYELGHSPIKVDENNRKPIDYTSELSCYEFLREVEEEIMKKNKENISLKNYIDSMDKKEPPKLCLYKNSEKIIRSARFVINKLKNNYLTPKEFPFTRFFKQIVNMFENMQTNIDELNKLKRCEYVKYEPSAGAIMFRKILNIEKFNDKW